MYKRTCNRNPPQIIHKSFDAAAGQAMFGRKFYFGSSLNFLLCDRVAWFIFLRPALTYSS